MARTLKYLAALVLLAAATNAKAVEIFTANLTVGQEPPGSVSLIIPGTTTERPTPFGNATFVLNDTATALSMNATIFNIDVTGSQTPGLASDNLTAAHIHAAGTNPLAPTFPVVWGFFGLPDNDTNAGVADVLTPFATGVGGTFASVWDVNEGNAGTTLTAQLNNIRSGLSYINFHTVQNPGGEIRGALLPEPGSIALLALALLGLGFSRRKRG